MKMYKHNPLTVKAIKWDGSNLNDFLVISNIRIRLENGVLSVQMNSCWKDLDIGDYYYFNLLGEWESMGPNLFEELYTEIS